MVGCEFCDQEFDSEKELHLHWGEEHREELNSHQKEKVKKAERDRNERQKNRKRQRQKYVYTAVGLIAVLGLAAGAYTFMPDFAPETGNIGPAGSDHYHADFAIYIEGEKFDFSGREYQVVDDRAHVEGLSDEVIHAHATGITFGYFIETLGWEYNSTALKTRDATYLEGDGKETRMFIDEGDGWKEVEPKDYRFPDGSRILLAYGDYTEQEIRDMQRSVTDRAPL